METSFSHLSLRELASSEPETSAAYQPLDPKKSEFRVLVLLGGKKDDELKGFLETIRPTEDDGQVNFIAVSYCWGSDLKPCTLNLVSAIQNREDGFLIDDESVVSGLPITASLDAILRSIRKEGLWLRRLWIDQLCINQDDKDEKTHQVRQMSMIYQLASETLIWLGKGNESTELAFQTARKLAAMKDWKDDEIPSRFDSLTEPLERLSIWPEAPQQLEKSSRPRQPDHPWKTFVTHILQQDWFTRTWVIQELCVSQSPLVWRGDYVLDWDTIWYACDVTIRGNIHRGDTYRRAAVKHAHNLGTLRREAQELNILTYSETEIDDGDRETGISGKSHPGDNDRDQRIEYLQQRLTLESLLPKTRMAAAMDPKDKVFALLNISTTGELDIIDYNKTLAGAYLDAAFSWQRPVELLDHVDLCAMGNKTNKLPFWLPNWYRAQGSMESLLDVGEARAGIGVEPPGWFLGSILRHDKYVALMVRGLKVLTVAAVGPIKIPDVNEDVPEGRNHAEMMSQFEDPYPTTEKSYLECYKSVIEPCAEDYQCSEMTRRGTVWDHKEKIAPNPEALKPSISSRYTEEQLIRSLPVQYWKQNFYTSERPSTNRRFFVTKEGFMGLGSDGIEPGDPVCAFFGGRLLYIVRPIESSTEAFQFMGNCYIYGLMNGEVFHGYPEDQVQDFLLS